MTSAIIAKTAELPPKWTLADRIGQFRRVLSDRLGCAHDQLVFDEINDVSCKHCGEDFTD
jgi:ribosomal protein S27E